MRRRLGLVALFWFALATVGSATALAGPPPAGTVGPLVQVDPSSGRAAVAFTADYWYDTGSAAKCIYTSVDLFWDGKKVATVTMDKPNPKDLTYCSASHTFKAAPSSTVGSHTLAAAACYVDVNRVRQCPRTGRDSVTYTVSPTPTLKVAPASGRAPDDFTATYATGQPSCNFTAAQFSWDGVAIGGTVPIEPKTCTAVLDASKAPKSDAPGAHRITAEACTPARCIPTTRASATYTVLAPKPTATPTATPRAVVTAVPSASVAPSPSASVAPSASPSAVPSASVAPTPVPRPTPTAAPTATPAPTASAAVPAVTTPTSGPPSSSGPFVPALATYVTGPEPGGIDPAVVATNLLLTLLLVFLFALTAEIFNSTMDAHRDEVHGWWLRIAGGPFGILNRLTVPGASLTRLTGTGRFGSIARVLLVLFLLGFVYSALSPDFGFNTQTVTLFISLVIALGFLTYFTEGSTTRLAHQRYRANASVRLYGTAVIVSVLAVVISRLVEFQPGLVYGFIASAVIVTPVALARRDDATLVLVPAVGLLVVSVLAWLLLGPVREAAAGGALAPGLAETILAMVVIGGLETLFVSMIPLSFMDGATVMGWSRVAWALAFGTVTFLWWQLLLNQDHAYVSAMEQTNVQVVLGTVVVFMLTTGGLWSYFRFRPNRPESAAEA